MFTKALVAFSCTLRQRATMVELNLNIWRVSDDPHLQGNDYKRYLDLLEGVSVFINLTSE